MEEHEIILEITKEPNEIIQVASQHLDDKHNEMISETLYQCLNCSSIFNSNTDLENHLLNDHNFVYCKRCKVYYNSEEDEMHQQSHTTQQEIIVQEEENQPLFCCDKCMLYFLEEKLFMKHCKTHHDLTDNEEKIIEFDEITFETEQKDHYQTGQSHTEQNPVIEPVEEAGIYDSETSAPNDKKFYCSICNAMFATQKSLHIHFNSKKCLQESFECDICKRVFAKKKYLLKHIVTSHCSNKTKENEDKGTLECEKQGKRRYKCTICPKGE